MMEEKRKILKTGHSLGIIIPASYFKNFVMKGKEVTAFTYKINEDESITCFPILGKDK